jgi:phage portal protein BeeE
MQFVEGKHLNSEEILANYRGGPEMLGKTESQTRANAEAAIFVFIRFGILPFLELFADVLTNDYLPAFPGTDGLEFGFPDPVPENMEEKRANAKALFDIGALTPDEARKDFGREPLGLPGMDTPYLPISVSPVGEDPVEPNIDPKADPALAA